MKNAPQSLRGGGSCGTMGVEKSKFPKEAIPISFLESFIEATAWEMDKPKAYGPFHLIFTFVGLAVCILLAYLLRHTGKRGNKAVLLSVGIFLAVTEIYKQLFYYYYIGDHTYQWWIFPFQLCSVPMYLCLIAPFLKEGKVQSAMYHFMTTFNLLGGLMAFIEPSGIVHEYWTLTPPRLSVAHDADLRGLLPHRLGAGGQDYEGLPLLGGAVSGAGGHGVHHQSDLLDPLGGEHQDVLRRPRHLPLGGVRADCHHLRVVRQHSHLSGGGVSGGASDLFARVPVGAEEEERLAKGMKHKQSRALRSALFYRRDSRGPRIILTICVIAIWRKMWYHKVTGKKPHPRGE